MTSADLSETRVLVSGLNCAGCVATLTRRALGVYGVVHVEVDLDPGRESAVTLRHSSSVDAVHVSNGLSRCGYQVRALASV